MHGIDKAKGRVVALVVLLILAAAALRGYLPGAGPAHREQSNDNPAAFFAVVALLSVSVAIVAIAIIMRLRDRRAKPAAAAPTTERFGGTGGLPAWRWLLIGLALVVAWLLLVSVLLHLGAHYRVGQPASAPESGTAAHSDGAAPQPAQRRPPETGRDMLGYLSATTVALVVLVTTGTLVASQARRRVTQPDTSSVKSYGPPTKTGVPETLARAAELGLAEIGDLNREPREAIIACYAAMEREFANVPGAVPQDCDTATEVLARAIEHHAVRAGSATELVELFAEARFSPHVMNEGHREVAVRVLERVLAEVRSAA
jgi:Domain of unknown function (DUF4129)